MNKRNKVRQYIAGILSAATVLGTVYQPAVVYSAEEDTENLSSVVVTEEDTDHATSQSVSQGSVSGNGETSASNNLSVSGGDVEGDKLLGMLTVSGSDALYRLDEYFSGETFVAIRGKSTSEVSKIRSGDDVTMDLAWDIDVNAISPQGVTEFSYSLPAGVFWEESEGNIGNGTYRLADGALSVYYDMDQAEGHINAHLFVSGSASTYALADASGNIQFPDGSAYASYDEMERLAAIAREWAEKGLLPYENYSYGDPGCSNNEVFDRHKVEAYTSTDVERLDAELGEIGNNIYCMYISDLAEIIRMAEDGMDLGRFFSGTVMQGIELWELYEIQDAGYGIDDVVDILLESSNISPYAEGRVSNILVVKDMRKYTGNLGLIPQFSATKTHGPMWMNTTSEGKRAWCLKYGGSCSKGYTYVMADPHSILDAQGMPLSDVKIEAIKAAAEMHDIVGDNEFNYQVGQILTWYILNNNISTSMDVEALVWPVVRQAIANTRNLNINDPILSDTREYHAWTVQWFECFRVNMGMAPNPLFDPFPHRKVTLYFWKPMNDDGNKQPLLTWESAENEPKGSLYCTKLDENGNPLAGCVFRVYNSSFDYVGAFISSEETKKITLPVGIYWLMEISAPTGYNIDPNQHKVTISASNHYEFYLTVVDTFVKPEVEINKYDSGTNVRVKGYALLQVFKKDGDTVGDLVTECHVGEGGCVNMRLDPGEYILREKNPPTGYLKALDLPFTVPDVVPSKTVVNMYDEYISVAFAKKDADDKNQYVPGALLALYPANANWKITSDTPYDQWISDNSVHRIDRIPAGNYILKELAAPEGYMCAADMKITIKETTGTQFYTMYDNKRTLSILKVAYDDRTGQKEPLAGAHLQLWATDGNGNKTEMIEEWDSTTEPHVINGVSINIKYILTETVVPEGYVGFGEQEIVFGHQHTASCYHRHGDGTCNGGSCSASITSVSSFYGWWRDDNDEMQGCQQCGTLKEAHGMTHCKITCSAGHTSNGGPGSHVGERCGASTPCSIDTTVPNCGLTEGDIDSQVIEVENVRNGNPPPSIKISKIGPKLMDATVTCELEGARLELRNADGVAAYTWVTDGTPYIIENITPGRYTLVEVETPEGYVTAEPMEVIVKDITTLQSYTIYDDDTEIKIRKVDAQTKEAMAGATLQIYYANADGSRGAKYGSAFITSLDDHVLNGIPVGKYLLVEEKAPAGYALAEPVAFEVKDTASTQTVVMYDHPIRVEISKKDITSHGEITGAQLTIWNTNQAGQKDRIYTSWTTDGTPHMIEKMAAGSYILEETIAAAGYVKAAEIPFTVTATGDIQRVTMYDDYTRVEIDKLNNFGTKVPGAKMALVAINSSGVIQGTYASWTTSETAHSLDHVPAGKYILMEVEPPKGYLAADPITIEIKATSEIQKYVMKDEFYHISLTLEKVHGMTGEHLKGDAGFELYEWNEAAGGYELSKNFRIVRKADGTYSVTSSYAWAEDGELYWTPANQGKFYYKETKAPTGYVIDPAPVYINVLDYDIVDDDNAHHAHNSNPAGYFIKDNTKFADRPWQLKFNLKKVDAITGNMLTDDTKFALYEWSEAAGGYIVSPHYSIVRQVDGSYVTESSYAWAEKGYLYYTDDNRGRFYYQEVKAPQGYELDHNKVYIDFAALGFSDKPSNVSKEYKAHNADPGSYYVNDNTVFANQPAHVRIQIPKVDRYTGNLIGRNAEFVVKAKEGSLSYPVTITKQEDGSYLSSEIYFEKTAENHNHGIFYVYEKKSPENYYGDYANDDTSNAPNGEAGKNVYLFKIEMDLSNNGDTIKITNDDAGEEYWNERQYGEVTVRKYDNEAEAEGITQGDIKTLDGAVYGLYAAEDIKAADGSGVIFEKGALVRTATIGLSTMTDRQGYILDADGNRCIASGKEPAYIKTPGSANFQQVELGRYYIAEISPAEGYLLDTTDHRGGEPQKYYVTFTYTNESEHVVLRRESASDADNNLAMDDASDSKDVHSGDFIKKQAAQFIKLEDLSTETGKEPIEAGFSIYLISDLSGVRNGTIAPAGDEWNKKDIATLKGYDFSGEQTAIVYKRGTEVWTDGDKAWLEATGVPNQYRVKEMWSNENGYFITPELPYGQYVLVETSTPEGKESADPMIITIGKDSAQPQAIRYIGDETLECYIRLVKADSGDGMTVLKDGAAYRIRLVSDPDSFDSAFWRIYDDGYLYYWDPLTATEMGSARHPFKVSNRVEDGKTVDSYIEMPYMLPFGDYELVEVSAPEGYVIAGSEQALKDASSSNGNNYEVSDAPAKPVIFSVTNSVLPDAAIDQYGRVIVTVRQENKQQKGILEITKMGEQLYDAEITGSVSGSDSDVHTDFVYEIAPVRGAQFEVFAAEDIYSQHIDGDQLGSYNAGQYLVWEKGDTVGTITTDQMGYAYLADLYLGKYGVREVVAGDGFILNEFEDEFEITAAESTKNYIVYGTTYENKRQKAGASVVKKDADTGKPVAGAVFALIAKEDIVSGFEANENGIKNPGGYHFDYVPGDGRKLVPAGTVIDCAVSDDEGIAVFDVDLPLGRYVVKELAAPAGYYESEEECLLDASYQGQDIAKFELSCELLDKPVLVGFSKYDIAKKEELPGVYLEVIDGDGNVVDSWVSGDKPHYIKYMEIGKTYVMREIKPVDGYVTAEQIVFTVLDMRKPGAEEIEIQEINMYDDVTKVEISKKDITTKEELPGAKLEVWTADDNGNKVKMIDGWISGNGPHYIEKLPVGKYILVETSVPEGYVTAEEIPFTVRDTGEIQSVEMLDDVTKVKISKKDFTTKEELPGATLQIWSIDVDGNKVELLDEWISEEESHYIEKLPVGRYVLVEASAPEGYLVAEEVSFEVEDTGEVQYVEMQDDYTKVKVSKKDITTKEELPGAELEVWTMDENGNKVKLVAEWISTREPHYIDRMPTGDYILTEVSAPDGYNVAEDVRFTVEESGGVQYVEMYDTRKPSPPAPTFIPDKPEADLDMSELDMFQTGEGMGIYGNLAIAVVSLAVGIGVLFPIIKKRKKK